MPILNIETGSILIFKTNINHKKDIRRIAPVLNNDARIITWNVDTGDSDKVLRVESRGLLHQDIVKLVQLEGYHCEELTD